MSDAPALGVRIARARSLLDLRRHDEASVLLRRVLADDPGQAVAWRLLARAQIGAQQAAEALRCARRACALDPTDAWAHHVRSHAATKLGRHEEAIEAARRTVALAPNSWQSHARLAEAIAHEGARRGVWAQANAAAERAVELGPDEPDTHFLVGTIAAQWGLLGCAEDAFQRTLALDPTHVGARFALAWLHMDQTKHDRGSRLAQSAESIANVARADPRNQIVRGEFTNILRATMARLATLLFLAVLSRWLICPGDAPLARASVPWLPSLMMAIPLIAAVRFVSAVSSGTRRATIQELTRGSLGLAFLFLSTATLLALAAQWLLTASIDDVTATSATFVVLAREVLRAAPQPAPLGVGSAGRLRRWSRTWRTAAREVVSRLGGAGKGRLVAVLRMFWLGFLLAAAWVIVPVGHGWPLIGAIGGWLGLRIGQARHNGPETAWMRAVGRPDYDTVP